MKNKIHKNVISGVKLQILRYWTSQFITIVYTNPVHYTDFRIFYFTRNTQIYIHITHILYNNV